MTRETMIDPRGSEYGVYVATREVERRHHKASGIDLLVDGPTWMVSFYGDEETTPRFTLRLSAEDYPRWRSHVGGEVLTATASWDMPEFPHSVRGDSEDFHSDG